MSSERINEAEQHELDVIDAIVRGGGEARPEDAALTDFALLVRNVRPIPNHGEAAALDARIGGASSAPKTRQSLIFKPMLAGVCLIVLVGAVTGVAFLSTNEGQVGPMSAAQPDFAATAPSSAERATAEDLSRAKSDMAQTVRESETAGAVPRMPGALAGVTSSEAPREVARDTRITLAAAGQEIARISDRVNVIVDRYGGYVASSKVRGEEGNRGRATFALMIPASQYKPALSAISKLAHVRSRSQSSEDITTAVNSADRELDRATARVIRLEDQLAAAETAKQRASLRRQLASANSAKRAAARQVRDNRARVNYVPIALTIVADRTAASRDKGEIAKAFDRAGKILTGIAAVMIIALAVLIPIASIVAAAWIGVRRWNRVRADRAIESATARQDE